MGEGRLDSAGTAEVPRTGSCTHNNVLSDSIKCREFLVHFTIFLREIQLGGVMQSVSTDICTRMGHHMTKPST